MYTHPQQGVGSETQKLRSEAGTWLKSLRESRNISQRQMAKLVNIEYYTFVSQVESGRGRIPPDRYEIWAKALGVDVRSFVQRLMSYYDPLTYQIIFGAPAPDDIGSRTVSPGE